MYGSSGKYAGGSARRGQKKELSKTTLWRRRKQAGQADNGNKVIAPAVRKFGNKIVTDKYTLAAYPYLDNETRKERTARIQKLRRAEKKRQAEQEKV